jgi:SAM-dependent methyltransferase
MAYRPTFDCLWCGTSWTTHGTNDLEGWAQLCPTCLGKAGDNPFLRVRLRRALAARVSVSQAAAAADAARAHAADQSSPAGSSAARSPAHPPSAAFPDDWFLRRGSFERGALHDAAWAAELDMVTRWLDGLALRGKVVEPAAGTGFFSPLLADAAELFAFDPDGQALDLARDRLAAHHLRAHLHVGDPWAAAAPDPGPADGVLASFLLGRVRGAGLDPAVASLRDRLRPGGRLAVIDLLPDPDGGPPPGVAWTWHDPAVVEAALRRAGLTDVVVETTGRFFVEATGVAP